MAESKRPALATRPGQPGHSTRSTGLAAQRKRPVPAARQRGFLDFSFTEIVITFGVALVVLGPKKLPGLVGQIGRWVGRARMMARQFREQLEHEVSSVQSAVNVTQPSPQPPTAAATPGSASGVGAEATPGSSSAPEPPTAPPQSFHADSPTHFTMNGTTPGVSFSNPLDDAPETDTLTPVAPAPASVDTTPEAAPVTGADLTSIPPADATASAPPHTTAPAQDAPATTPLTNP